MTGNGWSPPWFGYSEDITPQTGKNVGMPCVFQELKSRDSSIRTASLYDWNWIRYMSNRGYPGMVDFEVFGSGSYEEADQYTADNATGWFQFCFL